MPVAVVTSNDRAALLDVDFHHAVVEFSGAQFLAQLFARAVGAVGGFGLRGHQQIEQTLFGVALGALADFVEALLAHHVDGDFDQVANHGFDVAADVADFGELAGFDFEKRRIGELREAARELGFADAGGADHEDVFRHHLLGHFRLELLAADAIAQRDGDGALGVGLADDVFIEFADDFAGGQLVEHGQIVGGLRGKIDHHQPSSSNTTLSLV